MYNNSIKLFSDSTCDLSEELIKEMDIGIIPLYVTFGDTQYRDGVDLFEKELYEHVTETKNLPKTAAPSPADFEEAFKPYAVEGYDIIYISISSKMSACYQNAKIAAEAFPEVKIVVVDSMNLSTGVGLQVCAAYDLIKKGLSVTAVAETVRGLSKHVKTAFTIETLEYLYKGGRCNAVQALLSGVLHIMPIIQVENGEMKVGAKVRGKKRKALDFMIDKALSYKNKFLYGRMFITFTSGSEEDAKYMKARLEDEFENVKIYLTNAGCVIASHCGKKTIGVLYIAED